MGDIAIKVENLGKAYTIGASKSSELRHSLGNSIRSIFKPDASRKEEFWALRDISFQISKGDAVGIVGRNGAGKSTLLKILSRITDPTKGRFEINGRVSSLLEVGTGFHPELSGRENIFLNGTILGMRRAEIRKKFDEIVDFSGVSKFIETPVKHYSSGMKVRLAFSVAAHLEPEILIVDEVLAVGDAEFQKKCLGKMDEVSKEGGRTVIFVSHNMGAVQQLCNSGILLNQGNIEVIDTAEKVVSKYLKKQEAPDFNDDSIERQGSANVRVKELIFLDSNDNEIDDVISGKPLKIKIRYESNYDKIRNVIIGLSILNSYGQFMTVLNNKMSNFPFEELPGNGEITCDISRFPLMYGAHTININLFVDNVQEDYIESAKRFNVENADFYSSGFPNSGNRQGIYIDQEWKTL